MKRNEINKTVSWLKYANNKNNCQKYEMRIILDDIIYLKKFKKYYVLDFIICFYKKFVLKKDLKIIYII